MSQQPPHARWFDNKSEWPEIVFIRRMKRERTRRGWSQERLAREVNERAGPGLDLHPTAITKLEREGGDRRNLRLNEAIFIAEALDLRFVKMLSDDDQTDAETAVQELARQFHRAIEEQVQAEMHLRSAMQLAGEYATELASMRAEILANEEADMAGDYYAQQEIDRIRGK